MRITRKTEYKIHSYQEAFRALSINPNKHLCSIESLFTRITKGKGMPHINPIVDLGNAVSLKHTLSMSAHDMVVQSKYYPDAIYCIDEPETHMHTKLQGRVLRELYLLIPGQSQLWLSTHSIGMLQEAEEIEKEHPGTVTFLDFGGRDFDTDQVIRPAKIGKAVMDKFYELAFGDFAKLMLPKTIVFCEGDPNGKARKDFDKIIYSTIFSDTHPEAFFISGGSCNDIENIEKTHGEIINTLLQNSQIIKIVDRDDRSSKEVSDLATKGIKVLKERNLESYLLDDTVLKKLCDSVGKPEECDACLREKNEALTASIARGNAPDDYKSARGDIYNALKKRLALAKCGNNADAFIRDTLAPLITPDIRQALKRLKPRERDLLEMKYFSQLDDEKIGRQLRISRNSVRYYLTLARRALRDEIKKGDGSHV